MMEEQKDTNYLQDYIEEHGSNIAWLSRQCPDINYKRMYKLVNSGSNLAKQITIKESKQIDKVISGFGAHIMQST